MGILQIARRPDRHWDALCRRCGLCCYERDRVAGGIVVHLDRACPRLDKASGSCTVYDRRFRSHARCSKVTLLHALFGLRMPLTCGYARAYRPWFWRHA
jgi:uncharacterized cysteine cluster protein YcgN (CxxCxxCC family)